MRYNVKLYNVYTYVTIYIPNLTWPAYRNYSRNSNIYKFIQLLYAICCRWSVRETDEQDHGRGRRKHEDKMSGSRISDQRDSMGKGWVMPSTIYHKYIHSISGNVYINCVLYVLRNSKSGNPQKFPGKTGTDQDTWIKRNISNFSHANIIWTKP